MKSFGKFFLLKRKKHGFSQLDFLINHAAVSRIENGVCSPTFRSLIKIAKVFKVPVWELLKEFEESKKK